MAHLFSPITIARTKLKNRIVMAPLPSGYAALDGFACDPLVNYYSRRARGGVGLIITEPASVVYPQEHDRGHLGLYADVFIPHLRQFVQNIHEYDTRILVTLEAPAQTVQEANAQEIRRISEQFVLAAWRALAAGFDGVMLSAADGGALHALLSPLKNRRTDAYGKSLDGRLRMMLDIIETIHRWMDTRLLVGVRLVAEEFEVGGISLQDARVITRRVVGSGVNILDVTADAHQSLSVARFPGWCIPLASTIKRFIPDVPVIGSGSLGEPHLADSVIREGSVDLVMLGNTLRKNPEWPTLAHSFLVGNV